MDSYTGAHPDKFTKTQMRISHSLLGGTNALSPLSPRLVAISIVLARFNLKSILSSKFEVEIFGNTY